MDEIPEDYSQVKHKICCPRATKNYVARILIEDTSGNGVQVEVCAEHEREF